MTRGGKKEYTAAVRGRYLKRSRKEKGRILDEFTQVVGYHHKATIRLLRRDMRPSSNRKRGKPRKYGIEAAMALKVVWEPADRRCSPRLHPFMGELISVLRSHGAKVQKKIFT